MTDRPAQPASPSSRVVESELDERLAVVEAHGARADFDRTSWVWMILLGLVLPCVLLAIGWWL